MKSLHLNDLKKNEAVPDSYEIAVAYKGSKVEIIFGQLCLYAPAAIGNGQQCIGLSSDIGRES